MARLTTKVTCAMCPTEFFPWHRTRGGRPTCSIKCARALTSIAQRGKPMVAAMAAQAKARANVAEEVGRRFGAKLTPREVAIYHHGVRAGKQFTYRLKRKALRDTQAGEAPATGGHLQAGPDEWPGAQTGGPEENAAVGAAAGVGSR